jgi:hypothetical protein
MDQNARFVRCQELLEADVNGEIVALHVERGQCYGLNGVASEIWRMLASPTSANEVCVSLRRDYNVDPGTCETQVAHLLSELQQEGLIKEARG